MTDKVIGVTRGPIDCMYPKREDYESDEPPYEFEEWAPADGHCAHEFCIQAAYYSRTFRRAGQAALTREERDELNADRELVMDETHGRGF